MINDAGRDVATSGDIEDGVSVFYASCMVLAGVTFGLFLCFL
jgi:adenosylcobinamide-phosphate synthase